MSVMKFNPEDFSYSLTYRLAEVAADNANAKLEAWLNEQPIVYGYAGPDGMSTWSKNGPDTHQARLVCIEPIKPKCENHSPSPRKMETSTDHTITSYCRFCGVELVAEWRAK